MKNLPNWPYPRFIAHRGGGSKAPENTLAAMRYGFEAGYRGVEFDVKLTSDLHPILLHDTTLERTTDGKGNAGDLSLGELLKLDAGSWFSAEFAGEPIPTLLDIARYTLANNIASNVEIKPTPGQETLTGTLVARQAVCDWSDSPLLPLLSSFSAVSLKAAMIEAPNLPRGLIADTLPQHWSAILAELDCLSIHLKHTTVTQETVRQIHQAGYRLAVWTVNDPQKAKTLHDWGVDSVITDAIDQITPD